MAAGLLPLTAAYARAANFNAVPSIPDAASTPCAPNTSCNLRSAITAAAAADGNTVTVAPGTYLLNAGLGSITVEKGISIRGTGAASTIIDGTGNGGGFLDVEGTPTQPISVSATTIQNFSNSGVGGAFYISLSNGTYVVALNNVVLTGNHATETGPDAGGGAIYLNAGTLNLAGSTVSNNHADAKGGGINSFGTLNVTSSTISGNTAGVTGGGIYAGELETVSSLSVTSSTISGNTASGGTGGGIDDETNSGGTTQSTFRFDTIAGNTGGGYSRGTASQGPSIGGTLLAGNTGAQCNLADPGSPTSTAPNLVSDRSCSLVGAGDLQGTDPLLAPLANNGGPTETQSLGSGSPAIDAAGSSCPSTDQRGVVRPQGLACDIGAYEVAPPSATTNPATAITTQAATLNGQASNPDVVAGTVYFQYGTTTSYGSQTAAQPLAAMSGPTNFTSTLTGLAPNTLYHFRAVASNPDGTSFGADQTFTTAATIVSGLLVSPRKLSIAGRLVRGHCVKPTKKNGSHKRCRRAIRLNVSYTLNAAGIVTLTLYREVAGRTVRGRCVKPSRKNKHKKLCPRFLAVPGKITGTGHAGANSFAWDGKLGGHKLGPGNYQLVATPSGGPPQAVTFKIVP